jgi:hypothetical protein
MARADLLGIDTVLRIDGQPRSLSEVDALFQGDPYPGGLGSAPQSAIYGVPPTAIRSRAPAEGCHRTRGGV